MRRTGSTASCHRQPLSSCSAPWRSSTLGAALLHGPALAGLGVIGAYLAPMLVASTKPDFWSLYVYIAVVNAAAFALARFRMWRWLAIAAVVLGALWTLPGTQPDTVTALGAHVFHALAGFALVATFLVCGLIYGPPAAPGMIDRLSTLALVVYLLAAAFLVLASRHDPVALTAFVVLTVATVAIAWRTEAAAGAVPAAAILAALVMAHWAVHMNVQGLLAPSGPAAPAIPEPERYDYGSHLILAAGWAVLFGAGGFLAQGRSSRALVPMLWSAAAVFAPLAMLVALYYRIAQLDRSLPFAALALLVAAIFGLATETLMKREPRPGVMAASAMFATGTLGALALALTFALEKGWLTIALALTVPGIAWVVEQRPLPWLRWLAAIMVAVVAARVATNRRSPAPISAPRRSSTGCSTAMASRPRRSGSRDGCCGGAPTICRRAWSMPAPSCSRCCSRSWRSATTSPAATSTGTRTASSKPCSTSMSAWR